VGAYHRQCQALQTETDARTVRRLPVGCADVESPAEVVAVAVARHHRGALVQVPVQAHHQFRLEVVALLASREQPPGAAEERVVGGHRAPGQTQIVEHLTAALHPVVPVLRGLIGRADPDELVLAEGLHPGGVHRRLVPKAVALHVQEHTIGGQLAGQHRVGRVAGRRHEGGRGRRQPRIPGLSRCAGAEHRGVIAVVAAEGVNGTGEVRKRRQIVGPVEVGQREHRGETVAGHVSGPGRAHHPADAVDHVLERPGSPVKSSRGRRHQQAGVDQRVGEGAPGSVQLTLLGGRRCRRPDRRRGAHVEAPRCTSASCALLAMMRSLLTIKGAPNASRR